MFARWLIITVLVIIISLVSYFSNIIEGNENLTTSEQGLDNTVNPKKPLASESKLTKVESNPTKLTIDDKQIDMPVEKPEPIIMTDDDGNIVTVTAEDESATIDTSIEEPGTAWVKDKDGNMVALTTSEPETAADKLADNINYYEPGTYKYGSSTYVPSYEDSIYLSKTTGKSTVTEFVDESSTKGGICTHYKDMPEKLEEECGKINTKLCAATNCCVLLGGSKCVAGNATGPTSKLHYGDVTIRNRDYYYYKGKCYGNCVK